MSLKTIVGVFDSEDAVLAAARAASAAGLKIRDAYTPYPVHGMDQAMGLPPSWLSKVCLGLGTLGLTCAASFQYWVGYIAWPMNIGGKSFIAGPALAPVTFEITVLVAGVGTVLTLLVSRGLLPGREPGLTGLRATDDRFLLVVEGGGDEAIKSFYRKHGAVEVSEVSGGPR